MNVKNTELIESVYENFLTRDLTYLAAGAVIAWSCLYAFGCDVAYWTYFATSNVYRFLTLLGMCYFIGMTTKEGVSYLFKLKHVSDKISLDRLADTFSQLTPERKNIITREYNRTVFLEHVGVATFIASLVSAGVLMARPLLSILNYAPVEETDWYKYGALILAIALLCVFGYKEYRVKYGQRKSQLSDIERKLRGTEDASGTGH